MAPYLTMVKPLVLPLSLPKVWIYTCEGSLKQRKPLFLSLPLSLSFCFFLFFVFLFGFPKAKKALVLVFALVLVLALALVFIQSKTFSAACSSPLATASSKPCCLPLPLSLPLSLPFVLALLLDLGLCSTSSSRGSGVDGVLGISRGSGVSPGVLGCPSAGTASLSTK